MVRKLSGFLCAVLGVVLLCSGCQQAAPVSMEKASVVGFAFDTVVTLTAYGTTEETLQGLLSRCEEYEAVLSKTRENSDVWRINHSKGQPVEVSQHTATVLGKALEMSRLTDGVFDVTIAPATALWDFMNGMEKLPNEAALAEAVRRTDYRKVKLEGNVVTLEPNMEIDLGAIGKGYIADEMARLCAEAGIKSGILNFGGNVYALGQKPDKTLWSIGVQDPQSATGESIGVLHVGETSVVTSGIYERSFQLDGVTYHHLLDTKTGMPVQNELAGVTIVCKSSMEADALSTACFVLGTEKGLALLEQIPEAEGLFVDRHNNVTKSKNLPKFELR